MRGFPAGAGGSAAPGDLRPVSSVNRLHRQQWKVMKRDVSSHEYLWSRRHRSIRHRVNPAAWRPANTPPPFPSLWSNRRQRIVRSFLRAAIESTISAVASVPSHTTMNSPSNRSIASKNGVIRCASLYAGITMLQVLSGGVVMMQVFVIDRGRVRNMYRKWLTASRSNYARACRAAGTVPGTFCGVSQ